MVTKANADKNANESQPVFLTIDHLKDGNYIFNIMLDNKIIKSIKLKK